MLTPNATVTELWARGYAALPLPQSVKLADGELRLPRSGPVLLGDGVAPADAAVADLCEAWATTFGEKPSIGGGAGFPVRLSVRAGTVAKYLAEAVVPQAYKLEISRDAIAVTGNAAAGLYYGVQTLLHLLRPNPGGGIRLPLGVIEDWPDRAWRILHYDTKHHQDKLETVLAFIARVSAFKVNAIAWEIEDKFAYQKHPLIGAPGAFTTSELKQITAHALKRHVQIVPIVQGPSHTAFVLKHEAYAHLREDRANNYMACPSKDETYRLFFDMYDELIEATPGCRFFHIGTDEPYFLGDGIACGCRARREEIGQGGMMAEFIARCAEYLHEKGRTPLCWGEHPMGPGDIHRLPPYVINAVFQNPAMGEQYRANGNRELLYCPAQGARSLFPEYAQPMKRGSRNRLENLFHTIAHGPARPFDPLGVIVAGWDDCGLHLETLLPGYAAGSAYGWHPGTPGPEETLAQFVRIHFGEEQSRMAEAIGLLDGLAGFWSGAWDQAPSKRGPGYKRQWHPRWDRTLALPRVPDPETLDNQPFWKERYSDLRQRAEQAEADAARALTILHENLGRVRRNGFALEVFVSVVNLVRDHARLILALPGIEETLTEARQLAGSTQFKPAVQKLRDAARAARELAQERERMFGNLVATWEKSRLPKGQSVDGKHFVHIQDDTKNHEADWTPDLGYLVKAARDLDLEGWAARVEDAARAFMKRQPNKGRVWQKDGDFTELKGYGELERDFEFDE